MRLLPFAFVSWACCLVALPASATFAALTLPGGHGQQSLALRVEGSGIRARVCPQAADCTPDGGALLPIPDAVRASFSKATAATVVLAGGHAVAHLEVPATSEGTRWVMLLAAPLVGQASEPRLLWSGWIGTARGEHGEEQHVEVTIDPLPGGSARLLVGEQRADVTLCGRPALVAVREVDPSTLQLTRGASIQSLDQAERASAIKVTAERLRGHAPTSATALLRATAASSAVGRRFGTLTDGDPATAWSENKTGHGSGEFVTMALPDEVPMLALDLVVRPTEDVPNGAAPKRLYLATTDKLLEVTLPEDAWKQPAGTHYDVKLPAPLRTSCLALVLDEAFETHASTQVTLAEITAHTAFDGASPEALAGALAGGAERAQAAAALLVRSGKPGVAAAIDAYDKLDDEGRRLAVSVVDTAPCSDQAPFFAAQFAAVLVAEKRRATLPHEPDPSLLHARDRLRRCGRASASALSKLVTQASPTVQVAAADELALLAPPAAVPVLLDALRSADDSVRRDLRAALAHAAMSPHALAALHEELRGPRFDARSETVAIDLLRAVGPSLGRVEGASAAFQGLAARGRSMRARYLLLAPAAALARSGDLGAEGYLREALRKDQDPHVRRRAAEVSTDLPGLASERLAALDDPEPRVREAAMRAFAEDRPLLLDGLGQALGRHLLFDDWTFNRAAAARTLGTLPASSAFDTALVAGLSDRSAVVRARVLDSLGAHRAAAHAEAVRARQDDDDEDVEVRARAVQALGAMCDTRSIDAWTAFARGALKALDDKERRLGAAAIDALGTVRPVDLTERLAPLLHNEAPALVRAMAKAALAGQGRCGP